MSANEHIDELLSGFLDGELTAEELREFEWAMSVDGTLATKLEQFRQIGSDLRSIPKRTLGPDFADRVLAAAGQTSVHDSLGSLLVAPVGKFATNEPRGSWWRTASVVTALAASLLFAAYVPKWFAAPGEGLAVIPEEPVIESIATAEPENLNESHVWSGSGMRKPVNPQSFPLLTILEIEPTLKAWNDNEFAKVLNDAGIAWTNPVNVSDEVIGVLNDTRSISRGLPKSGDEQLALVMVMANGRRMDKALKLIFGDANTFPHVFMDMAFDLPGKELFEKLIGVNGQQAIATPIVLESAGTGNVGNSGLEGVSQFSGKRPAEYLASSSRQIQQFGTAVSDDEEDSLSYVLMIVRKPAK